MKSLTALDWIAVALAGLLALQLAVVFPFVWAPRFAAMFRDFGGPLPSLTRLALARWFPLVLALLPSGLLLAALGGRPGLSARRALIVGAFLAAGLGTALCLVALYLPIFQLAGAIR